MKKHKKQRPSKESKASLIRPDADTSDQVPAEKSGPLVKGIDNSAGKPSSPLKKKLRRLRPFLKLIWTAVFVALGKFIWSHAGDWIGGLVKKWMTHL